MSQQTSPWILLVRPGLVATPVYWEGSAFPASVFVEKPGEVSWDTLTVKEVPMVIFKY